MGDAVNDSATVRTTRGRLRGITDGTVLSFRGIPFAEPPVGPLRFRAPRPAAAWSGERDASRFGNAALQAQPVAANQGFYGAHWGAGSLPIDEDCLYLNVWTPAADPQAHLPVLCFVHGGGYQKGTGASAMYTGRHLAAHHGVVVVTVNYRLGLPGFLYHPGLGAANFGTRDAIAALEWVQQEIAAFGGDPACVTIFGESAGGHAIATLLASPLARGRFHRAIAQSPWNAPTDPEAHWQRTRGVMHHLGVADNDVDALREMPAARLLDAWAQVPGMSFTPAVDGDVLVEDTVAALAAGRAAGVPAIFGTNQHEATLFSGRLPGIATLDEAALRERAGRQFGLDAAAVEAALHAYRADLGAGAAPRDHWFALQTDQMFRLLAIDLAAAHAVHGPAWMYRFDRANAVEPALMGATHGIELPYVFGSDDDPLLRRLVGDGDAVHRLGAVVREAWTSFARSGTPRSGSLPQWPRYEPSTRQTLLLDDTCRVVAAPGESARRFWAARQPRE